MKILLLNSDDFKKIVFNMLNNDKFLLQKGKLQYFLPMKLINLNKIRNAINSLQKFLTF